METEKHTSDSGARRAAEKAKAEGERLASQARSAAVDAAERRKDAAVGYIKAVAAAVDSGARELDDQGLGKSASLLSGAAEELEGVADRTANRRVEELWTELEGLARRRPAIFFGAAFALGFGATRVLKSTSRRQTSEQGNGRTSREGNAS